ncbi:MAG TPA: monovalent cation/H+ antiporter complex subunit F [Solirubrobacteraceae bacterium]|jgi:multisubunit Na+/H+ antiporter MnhF subunit|nr:monovalent cation/H+ antiporter complex subunit F [Solirubrobacteraceae bacterium]
MNVWILASIVLLAALLPCVGVCLFAGEADALAAVEAASVIVTTALMLLSEGFHRQPFIDLAVTFAIVSTVGSLAFARMMEADI